MLFKKGLYLLFICFTAIAGEGFLHNDFQKWQVLRGNWRVEEGKYTIKEAMGQASLSLAPTPFSNSQVVEVNILIKERTNRLGWAAAGVCLWWDEGSFWRLSLVEAPDLYFRYPE
ncbi:MAG: hypothetical protein ACP5QS_08795, partial [bacterium]